MTESLSSGAEMTEFHRKQLQHQLSMDVWLYSLLEGESAPFVSDQEIMQLPDADLIFSATLFSFLVERHSGKVRAYNLRQVYLPKLQDFYQPH